MRLTAYNNNDDDTYRVSYINTWWPRTRTRAAGITVNNTVMERLIRNLLSTRYFKVPSIESSYIVCAASNLPSV